MTDRVKNFMYALLPVGIALYIIYPLLAGEYLYPISEYEIYKSFMVNFIGAIKKGVLPQWNEYVGSGHPALYFGHYPISQNTLFYMLFGFTDFTYYFTKFLNLTILFLSFIYACRYLKLSYLISLIGALVYFSVNFTTRFLIEDTIGNLVLVYPLLMVFIVKIIDENKKKDILLFSLFYIFWLAGGHIVFELMYFLMLSSFYLITVFVFYKTEAFRWVNLKRLVSLYLVLFIIPFLAVLYQYYFIYDVISASNRLKEGLIVSPFEPAVWKQLIVSFQSSSYFWVGLSLILIYAGIKLLTVRYGFIETRKIKIPSLLVLFIIVILFYALKEKPDILKIFGAKDYVITTSGHNDNYMLLKIDKDNMVVNGEFENDASGWTAYKANISSVDSGQSRNAIQIKNESDAAGYAYITIPTKIGENYKITAYYKNGDSALGQIKVGTSIDDTTLYYSGVISETDWKRYEGIFEATTKTTYVTLVNPLIGNSKGTTSLFDNVAIYRLKPTLIADYIPILKSNVFVIALILYFSMHLVFSRMHTYLFISFKGFFIFIIYISLLSHYLYSPSNINGYNYDLFNELSAPFRIIFLVSVLFSLKDYHTNRLIRAVVWSSIVLYLVRSHLAIPLLRFGGILWSTAKDGAIFSFFFAVLFMFGFKNILLNFFDLLKAQGRASKYIQYILLASVLILFVQDSFNKFYKGTANRYIYPNKRELANTPGEKGIIDAREEIVLLNSKLLALDKEAKHFYRVFTPENSYVYLAGNLQQHRIHEAAIYESSVSREFKEFYNYTILQKRPSDTENLKNVIPGSSFTKHVHAGFNLHYREIPYGKDIFMFDPRFGDAEYLRNENVEFLWDIMRVKYLIIGPEFSNVVEGFSDRGQYKLLGNYPKLNFNLYEITKDKSYSKLAVLPLDDQMDYEDTMQRLNSKDIDILKELYSKMVFLDRSPPDFNLLKSQNDNNKRYYEIYAKQKAILIDFESWNHNWELKINNKKEWLQQAFQIFKGMKIEPGLNKIELTYNLKHFKGLFFLSIFVVLIYVVLLGRYYYLERGYNNITKRYLQELLDRLKRVLISCNNMIKRCLQNLQELLYRLKINLPLFLQKYCKAVYYIVPSLVIIILFFALNSFSIDKRVINRYALWDMTGRPYETFLYEMNLPQSVGAIFVGGTPNDLVKTEKIYQKVNIGYIFTSQLQSLLFGTKITEFSIASYINSVFIISAILFSILAGYLIFKNGYISILLFLLIIIFRNFCQGLIYGLPLRHAYAVFNPTMAFVILTLIIVFLKNNSKKYWMPFILSGFIIAYIEYCRTSEGQIVIISLLLSAILLSLEYFRIKRENFKKILLGVLIVFISIYVGYAGFYKMIEAFEHHRDKKFNFPATKKEEILSAQPPFHMLFVSMFRYEIPNKFGDKLGYDAVYERYPEIKNKFATDVYFKLANSEEYNRAIRELYFDFVFHNPKQFLVYLTKSIYDYFLFLPYYSWTGNKSAHAYLPKTNENVEIETQDLAPDFKDTSLNWILNLKLKYLPNSLFFWTYFVFAYAMLIEAVYTSFAVFKKVGNKTMSANEIMEDNLPIYLLWGMLIYFFFASVVRILIPVHGQGAVVVFNIIVIYNMVRIAVSKGYIEIKKNKIHAWAALLILVLLFIPTHRILNIFRDYMEVNIVENGSFDNGIEKWMAYKSILSSVPCGQSGNCLQITTSENNATGIAYTRIPVKVGEMYRITAYFKEGTAHDGQINIGATLDDTSLYYSGILSGDKWRKYSGVFRASVPFVYITLTNLTSSKGLTSFFDSVYVTRYEYYSE